MKHITDKQKRMLEVVYKHGHLDVSLMELIDEDFAELVHKDMLVVYKSYTGVVVRINPTKISDIKDMINP